MPFTVFPLHPINADGTCGCWLGEACESTPGKHPAWAWSELAAGEVRYGPAGHGIATGARSSFFAVDTDGADADARFRELASDADLETYTVATPSGGRHYYYAWPGFPVRSSVGEFDWSEDTDGFTEKGKPASTKIDIRGDGGMVVAPGSPHRNGGTYVLEKEVPIAPAPPWLLEWAGLRGKLVATGSKNAPMPVDGMSPEGQRRIALGREACETFPAAVDGENGSGALFNVALRLVRDLELDIRDAYELVCEHFNPRCSPPWTGNQVMHKLTDARDKSDRLPGIMPADFDMAALAGAPMKGPEPSRRARNPAHVYECRPSDIGNKALTKTTLGNAISILCGAVPQWEGVLRYDEFRDRIEAVDPPIRLEAEKTCFVERDVTAVRKWFETIGGFILAKDTAWDAVISAAHENRYHPVREYLVGLPAGDAKDLDRAAEVFFGSTDALDRVLVRKFLIGAVRRVLNPGEKMDTMLVLVGPQGSGKSSFVCSLFGDSFTSEDLADLKSKDAMIGLAGKWAIEVAELDKILRQDSETVKAFISRRVDPYRAPYERVSTDHPRQCVYVGTTNKDDFLRDPTGERRYWIVNVRAHGVDLPAVEAWRDRLWAAAYAVARLPKKDEPHWLSEDEAALLKTRADGYKGEDGWSDAVATYCAGRTFVTTEAIFKAIGGSTDKLERKQTNRITDILRELGCTKDVAGSKHARKRGWRVPEELQEATLAPEEAARREGAAIVDGILAKVSPG